MSKVKAIIVDDERLARQRLQRLLLQEPDVDVIGQCNNVRQARELIAQGAPDLLFVDVQMPRASGFELIRWLEQDRAVAIIFVTAYEQYAVQAFDVKACDYLLKPVADARLKLAVQRAREILGRRPSDESGEPGSSASADVAGEPRMDSVLVRTESKVLRVRLESIDWIEAAGNYVLLHIGGQSHLLRETLTALETKLPAERFARIHRTVIANLDRIVEFVPTIGGDFVVTLQGGAQLRMSRNYRGRIRDLLGNSI
jgi:two-component system LytT family response regulator